MRQAAWLFLPLLAAICTTLGVEGVEFSNKRQSVLSKASPTAAVLSATFEVRHVGLTTQIGADTMFSNYRVVLFRVRFDRPFTVMRNHSGVLQDIRHDENYYGLTRLTCGRRIFDSHPRFSLPELRERSLPIYLLPLKDTKSHPLAELMAVLHTDPSRRDEYAAMLILDVIEGVRMGSTPRDARGFHMTEEELAQCTIQFLPEEEQNWKPTARMLDDNGNEAFLLFSPLMPADQPDCAPHAATSDPSVGDHLPQERVDQVGRIALAYVHDQARSRSRFRAGPFGAEDEEEVLFFPDEKSAQKALNASREQCIAIPDDFGDVEDVVLMESKATVQTQLKTKIFGLLLSVVEGLVEPIINILGGTMSDMLTEELSSDLGQEVDAELTNEVSTYLSHSLSSSLGSSIPPTLKTTIVPTVATETTERVRKSIADVVNAEVMMPVTRQVDEGMVAMFSKFEASPGGSGGNAHTIGTAYTTGTALAEKLVVSLGHTLSRSLAHSIVPALIHTLTHNPMQDYYCYYCFHKKVYCQYCNYSPQQVYYALYYAGFYSTYYSDYYSEFFAKKLAAEYIASEP